MSYDSNIPLSTQTFAATQPIINQNFGTLNTDFGVDHVNYTAISNNGKHNKSAYVEQSVDPATAVDEIAVYSKLSGTTSQIFCRNENNGTVFQLTGGGVTVPTWVNFNGSTNTMNQSVNVGSITKNGVGDYTINFTQSFSNASYGVLITSGSTFAFSGYIYVSKTASSFRFQTSFGGLRDSTDVTISFLGTLA